jgi:hypothetical protein
MSYAILGKAHIDALITAALRWSGSTLALELSGPVLAELNLSPDAADRMGLALMVTNWNTAVLGGDPDELDMEADEIGWMEQEYIDDGFVKPVSYSVEELPGMPSGESVLCLIHCYRYQSNWEGEGIGSVTAFVDALEQAARQQLPTQDDEAVRALPRYSQTPWMLGDADRDLFMRLA